MTSITSRTDRRSDIYQGMAHNKIDAQWIWMALIASLTLGLAPFFPEPHIVGKVKWMLGGGKGMGIRDIFDLFFHGIPWIILMTLIFLKYIRK